jgi:succinoglycan biosynthesis protein ExoW
MAEGGSRTIAVVVPFYQRDPRVLERCITSVFEQRVGPGLRLLLVIVDDGSPVPLETAMAGIAAPQRHEVVCLSRPNGGPGAARNTALDYLMDRDPEFVAFLDSDDTWRPDHISHALSVLADHADFFFCDHDRWNYPTSYLEASERFQEWLSSPQAPFISVQNTLSLNARVFEFRPDEAFRSFIEDYLAQTSTVVYRSQRCQALRFDESLRYGGEDNMFWLQLSKVARAVRFTTEKDVATGRGENMYAASIDWSHPDAARRTAATIRFLIAIKATFDLDAVARASLAQRLRRYEAEFVQIWIRKLFRAPLAAITVLIPLFRLKPSLALILPLRLFAKSTA